MSGYIKFCLNYFLIKSSTFTLAACEILGFCEDFFAFMITYFIRCLDSMNFFFYRSILKIIETFTETEQFYKRCHAVYGK